MDSQERIRIVLNRHFDKLKAKNPAYSLRAFAKRLDVSPSSLSEFFRGRRPMNESKAYDAMMKLKMREDIVRRICSTEENAGVGVGEKWQILATDDTAPQSDHYRWVTEIRHRAVHCMIGCSDPVGDLKWVAQRLDLSEEMLSDSIALLLRLKMIERDQENRYVVSQGNAASMDEIPSAAIRKAHKDAMALAAAAIEEVPVGRRDFNQVMFNLDPINIPVVKEITRKYLSDLLALSAIGDTSEVYNCCVQVYPLSKSKEEDETKRIIEGAKKNAI